MIYSVLYTEPQKGYPVYANFGRNAEKAKRFCDRVGGELKTTTRRGRHIPLTEIGRKLIDALFGKTVDQPNPKMAA